MLAFTIFLEILAIKLSVANNTEYRKFFWTVFLSTIKIAIIISVLHAAKIKQINRSKDWCVC